MTDTPAAALTVVPAVPAVRRHVIVTGGSRGLGLALVADLLAHGYRVSTCARSLTAELAALAGPDLFWRPCEVGDAGQTDAFVAAAVAWGGDSPLWGLVNNAGIAREGILATFPDIDTAEIIQINLTGAIQMARRFLREKLARRGPGRIINISSIIGQRGYTGLAAYSASKAGLDGLTRSLAREVGRLQITVNSIAPGYLDTDMSGGLDDGQRRQIIRRTPLGRLGRVDDVTPAVRFLLGDEAGFITGQTLTVDGGIIN